MSDTPKLSRRATRQGVLTILGDILGVTGLKDINDTEKVWKKRWSVLSPLNIPNDVLQESSRIFNGRRNKTTIVPIYKILCLELYRSFHAWKNHNQKKEERKTRPYSSFVESGKAIRYIFSNLIEYAIKSRNSILHNYLRHETHFQRHSDRAEIIRWALRSCFVYGNLEYLGLWMKDIQGRIDTKGRDSLAIYGNEAIFGCIPVGYIGTESMMDIMVNGHINSLKFIQERMTLDQFKRVCTVRSSLYDVAKKGRFKVIDMLVSCGAYYDYNLFCPTLTREYSNPRFFVKVCKRYWPKIDIPVSRMSGYVESYLRICKDRRRNLEMFSSPIGRAVMEYMVKERRMEITNGSLGTLFINRGIYSVVLDAFGVSSKTFL